jgi:cardiolipin synthase (CMP-forming)
VLRQIPNLITALRLLLIVPIALALLHHELLIALGLFFIAAVSDLLDGFIAKRFGWQSALGGVLDPAADKLAVMHLVPLWLMATAVARDLVIVSGAIAYRLWLGPVEARPSNLSKLNTLCQALFILCVIARQQFSEPDAWAIVTLGALTFLTTVVSGIDYVLRYGQAALEESRSRRTPERELT